MTLNRQALRARPVLVARRRAAHLPVPAAVRRQAQVEHFNRRPPLIFRATRWWAKASTRNTANFATAKMARALANLIRPRLSAVLFATTPPALAVTLMWLCRRAALRQRYNVAVIAPTMSRPTSLPSSTASQMFRNATPVQALQARRCSNACRGKSTPSL